MNVHICLNRYVMLFMYSTMFHCIVCFVQFWHICCIHATFCSISQLLFCVFTTLHVHALEDGGYKHNNLFVSVCNILSWFEKKKRHHHEGKSQPCHLIKIIVPIRICLFHFWTFCHLLEQLFRNMYRTISTFCTISRTSIDLEISYRW